MSRGRYLCINMLLASLITGGLGVIVAKVDEWPLSCHPMFAGLSDRWSDQDLLLVGVGANESVLSDAADFAPLRPVDVFDSFQAAERLLPAPRMRRLQALSTETLAIINAHRGAGNELSALRLYQRRWNALNPQKSEAPPDVTELRFESLAVPAVATP